MMRRLALLASLLAVAGCTAGPDYHFPEKAVARLPADEGPFASGGGKAFSPAEPPDRWWQLFGDARLDGYVAEALAANADLRVAEANLARADAVVEEVLAGRSVATSVGGGLTLARPAGTGATLPGTVGYDAGIALAYPLDLAGKIRRAVEAAGADAETVAAARDGVRVTVAAEVARSYAAVCTANLSLAATQRVLAVQQDTLGVTRRLQRGGRGTAFDVTRARTAAEQSAALVPVIVATRTAALYRLATLMGRPPANWPREAEGCDAAPKLTTALPVGDGATLLRRRPDLRGAERAVAAATARIGVATADLYPQVSLGGSVGLAGPLSSAGSGDAFHLSLGPLLSWSFPNRAATRARIAEADAATAATLAQFDSSVLEALRQTETALSAYEQERARNAALTRARDSAALAANQAGRLYRFGRTDFLALLSAQAALASAEATLAASDAQLVDRQVDLFKALGGGWQ